MQSIFQPARYRSVRVLSGLLTFSIVHLGCSSSTIVSSSTNPEGSSTTFNVYAKDERAALVFGTARVVFQDGKQIDAQDVKAAPDSTSFLNVITGSSSVVPTHEIEKIVLTDRFIGFLEGAGLGLIGGAGTGLAVGAIIEGGGGNGWAKFGLTVIGGLAGLPIGGILGLVLGHSYEYKFVHESNKP